MQRDKRGRFVKKATTGTSISLNNPSGMGVSPTLNFGTKKIRWNYKDGIMIDENGKVITAMDTANALALSLETAGDKLTPVDIATVKNI